MKIEIFYEEEIPHKFFLTEKSCHPSKAHSYYHKPFLEQYFHS